MSLARQALLELDALVALLARPPRLPAISRCREQADALPKMNAAEIPPPQNEIEALRTELYDVCRNGGPAHLRDRTLGRAPWVFWHGEPQAAAFPGLLTHFLDRAAKRERWLERLIEAWLHAFGQDRTGLVVVGKTIAARLQTAQNQRLLFWRRAHESYAVFDAEDGPRLIAKTLLAGPQSVVEVLEATGMSDPLRANGAYFRACTRALLDALPDVLRRPDADSVWRRATDVLEAPATRKLRFENMAGAIARACLAPFLSGIPPKFSHEPIQRFLVHHLGDPRVQPARWTGAGEEATALVRRWLTEATIEAFFALISRHSDDRQWQYRKAFWSACYRKRPETEFWVVLGADMARDANTMTSLRGCYGAINGNGVQNQAVLLIRIGDIVLSEWSNVGALRAWDRSDRRCPRFYQAAYEVAGLKAPCLEFPDSNTGNGGLHHKKPAKYLWQGRAASFLAQRTGLHLTQSDYAWSPQ